MFVLVTGNPFDGLKLHGPFGDSESANTYADNHYQCDEWNVVYLNPPDLDQPTPPASYNPETDCYTAQCAAGNHNYCPDTATNCCECACHHGSV